MEYYRTKDILYVMEILGHKSIKNALKYTQLVKFQDGNEFVCKVAKTPEEISALIETGFGHVCEPKASNSLGKESRGCRFVLAPPGGLEPPTNGLLQATHNLHPT